MPRKGDGIYLRGKTCWLDFMHQGERHQARLGRNINRTVARELAAVKRAEILKGEAGIGGKKRKDILFDKAAEEFLQWATANKRPKTISCYSEFIKALKKTFERKRLSEIHPFLVEKHKQMRFQEDARIAANRELACLKNIFNRCIQWKKYEGENPVRGIKPFHESLNRVRFLSQEEEAKLVAAAKEPLRTIILLGIHAGLRIKAEALTLLWTDIDLGRGTLTVQAAHAKNKQARTIPLNLVLRNALKNLKSKAQNEYVFTSRNGKPFKSIRTTFTTACKNASLTEVTPHVLRHTFASRLVMAGIDLRTVQELGGWKDLKMVMRYAHLSPGHKAEAVEKIANYSTTLSTTRQINPAASY